MCIGSAPKPQLPPTPPAAPTMADPAVVKARDDAQQRVVNSGLASTSLTENLGGAGAGARPLAGAPRPVGQ